jgi:alkyldihydroxyacetonephosphate synthase
LGWGLEDEQASPDELRTTAAFIRRHLGFGRIEPEQPVPLSAASLPPPRLKPPDALPAFCAADPYERALHGYGRSYADILRAFRGRFDHVPDVVVRPRNKPELESALDSALRSGAAVIPFGGGTSVVGGVEPRVGDRFAGVVTIDLKALDRVLDVGPVFQAARIQAGATGARLEISCLSAASRCVTFPSPFSLNAGQLDRHPGPAGTSPRCHPHR